MNELLRRLRDALDTGDDDVLPDILERLFDGIDETEADMPPGGAAAPPSEAVVSRGGAGPKPLGEAEGRPPHTVEAA